jgi:hypothetical protein
MNRRSFLTGLFAATAGAVIAPKVTYVFAPSGGWKQGLFASNWRSDAGWYSKTPEQILADINAVLARTWEESQYVVPDMLAIPAFVRRIGESDEDLRKRIATLVLAGV